MADEESVTQEDEKGPERKKTPAELIAAITTELCGRSVWDGEHSYYITDRDKHVRTLAVRSQAFKRWATAKLLERDMSPPTNQQWSTAADLLDASAAAAGTESAPMIRVTGGSGVVFIDLGDDDWSCIRITANGWRIEPHPVDGPYFYRPPRMASLPTPTSFPRSVPLVERVGRLYHFLNAASTSERMLLLAYLVQANWPRGPYPVLPVHGPGGSSKTTKVCVLKALTDPTLTSDDTPAVTSPRKPPRDERSIIAAARNNRIVAFDNVSHLDQWLSDALCRVATGAELGDRGLFSDFDEAVFTACRPIILNGVPDVVAQSDLADRCVQIAAQRPEVRISEEEFWAEFTDAWPELLGVVLDLISAALRQWDEGTRRAKATGADLRMKNYAVIGEALGVELGWEPGAFTRTYKENVESASQAIAESDIVTAPLVELLSKHGNWESKMKDLHTELGRQPSANVKDKDWPKSAKALSNHLTRLEIALPQIGISCSRRWLRGYPLVTLGTTDLFHRDPVAGWTP